ncbi:MAG: TldD/PmbA family protein [Oscillospiraceae bacterium]|jgi:PmbA protein|nr:TldD/PmbA family protein [Oscillospiraceae bacterium]
MKQELYDIAQFALDTAAELGAEGAAVSLSRGQGDELNVDAGQFSLMRSVFDAAIGIKVIVGGCKGSVSINKLDKESVQKAVSQAVEAAKLSEPDDAEYIADSIGEHEFEYGAITGDLDKLYERVTEFLGTCKAEYPKLDILQLITSYDSGTSLYANSNGSRVYSHTGNYSFSVEFSARDGDNTTSMNGVGVGVDELDTPFIERGDIRRSISAMEAQLNTVPVEGKFVGKLLVSPDCFYTFVYYVLANCVMDGALIRGNSPWKDKLGEIVADSKLSVTADSLDSRIVGSSFVTSDGHLKKAHTIIENGKLVNFQLGQYAAKKTGQSRAGDYSTAFIIPGGDKSFEEMLSSVDNGLLINRFSGGNPATNGEFSGVAKNSFLIKDGKITDAVSETMISGNLLDMLKNILALSQERLIDGGMVVPWALFDGVTISGK